VSSINNKQQAKYINGKHNVKKEKREKYKMVGEKRIGI
jgi:hypothetical protein